MLLYFCVIQANAQYIPFFTGMKGFETVTYFPEPNYNTKQSYLYCEEITVKSNNVCFATNITAIVYNLDGSTNKVIKTPYCYFDKDTGKIHSPAFISLNISNNIIKCYGYSCYLTNLNNITISNKIELTK
jgi:hypothetical protein